MKSLGKGTRTILKLVSMNGFVSTMVVGIYSFRVTNLKYKFTVINGFVCLFFSQLSVSVLFYRFYWCECFHSKHCLWLSHESGDKSLNEFEEKPLVFLSVGCLPLRKCKENITLEFYRLYFIRNTVSTLYKTHN